MTQYRQEVSMLTNSVSFDDVIDRNPPVIEAGGLALHLARSQDDVEAVQRLRYRIFTDELQVFFPGAVDGRDVDRYDAWCRHFMVCDVQSGKVVGTYRVLLPEHAATLGGYYSESEFDISPLDAMRPELVEVGRSCIHPEYRRGGVIMLLWTALAQTML